MVDVRSLWALWQNEDSLVSADAMSSRLDTISGHRRSRGRELYDDSSCF